MDAFTGKEQNRANVVPMVCQFEDRKKLGGGNGSLLDVKVRMIYGEKEHQPICNPFASSVV